MSSPAACPLTHSGIPQAWPPRALSQAIVMKMSLQRGRQTTDNLPRLFAHEDGTSRLRANRQSLDWAMITSTTSGDSTTSLSHLTSTFRNCRRLERGFSNTFAFVQRRSAGAAPLSGSCRVHQQAALIYTLGHGLQQTRPARRRLLQDDAQQPLDRRQNPSFPSRRSCGWRWSSAARCCSSCHTRASRVAYVCEAYWYPSIRPPSSSDVPQTGEAGGFYFTA